MSGEHQEIRIRHFSMADLPRALEIEPASFGMADAWSEPIFTKWHRRCPDLFPVAKVPGTIAGCLSASIEQKADETESIAVDPAFRCRGAASALMDHTRGQMCASAITTVKLQVRTGSTDAIRFRHDLGFAPSGILTNFCEDEFEALRMQKPLT